MVMLHYVPNCTSLLSLIAAMQIYQGASHVFQPIAFLICNNS